MPSPWFLPIIFGAALILLCGVAYWLRAGIRTRNGPTCWHCGVSKVRPSRSRSSDMLAGMFLLRPYRCGACLTRFYGFRKFAPALPMTPLPPLAMAVAAPAPVRKSPLRIRVKVIVRLPWPSDWQSAWALLLAEEQGFLRTPPDNRSVRTR